MRAWRTWLCLPLYFLGALEAQTISTFMGNGLTDSEAGFNNPALIGTNVRALPINPRSVSVDQSGNLFVGAGEAVISVDRNGRLLSQSLINAYRAGVASVGPLGTFVGSRFGSGRGSSCAVVVSPPFLGFLSGFFGAGNCTIPGNSGDGGNASQARFTRISVVGADRQGSYYVYDDEAERIRVIGSDRIVRAFLNTADVGTGEDIRFFQFDSGSGAIALDRNGLPRRFTSSGSTPLDVPDFSRERPFTIDLDDNVYYFRASDSALVRRSPAGEVRVIGLNGRSDFTEGMNPADLAWHDIHSIAADTAGNIYLSMHVVGRNIANSRFDFRVFRIQMPAIGRPDCSFTLSPSSTTVPQSGGPISVEVRASRANCFWQGVSDTAWITVSAAGIQQGNAALSIQVAANPGTNRTGNVTIGGQRVTLTQSGTTGNAVPVITGISHATTGGVSIGVGTFMSIYGRNLASSTMTWETAIQDNKLPTTLGDVRVLIGNRDWADSLRRSAFLYFVSPTQINVLLPDGTYAANFDVTVVRPTGRAHGFAFYSFWTPGWFTYPLQGRNYIAALIANTPFLAAPAVPSMPGSRPARAGEIVSLYLTGCGGVWPVGEVLTKDYPLALPTTVTIGGKSAEVLYQGVVYAGVCQVNAVVPEGLPSGPNPVVFRVLNASTQTDAVIEVGPGSV